MIVLKGTQTSLPPMFRCGKNINWAYEFKLPENGYDVQNAEEQEDWLKLIGVKPNYFSPMYDSKMIGFRWNTKNEEYEFCFYWHDKEKKFYFSDVIMTSKDGIVIVKLVAVKDKLTLTLGTRTNFNAATMDFPYNGEMLYLINTYWGGTLPMPKTLFFEQEKLK